MNKSTIKTVENSPWRRAAEAMAYFQIGRNQLDKLAETAGAKYRLAPKCVVYDVVYDIPRIEKYLRDEL